MSSTQLIKAVSIASLLFFVEAPNANSTPAIAIRPDLFKQKAPDTLGLKQIPVLTEILYRASNSGPRYSHHPAIAAYQGHLYAMWSNGPDLEDSPAQYVSWAWSEDGKRWSSPKTLAEDPDGPNGDRRLSAGGWLVNDTSIFAVFSEYAYKDGVANDIKVRAMQKKGSSSWRVWPSNITGVLLSEGPVRLADGNLLFVGTSGRGPRLTVVADWEQNGGRVVDYTDVKNPRDAVLAEPDAYLNREGSLICLFRNNRGPLRLYSSISDDRGARLWSNPEMTTYPDSQARIRCGLLPDGETWILGNPVEILHKRSPLVLAISKNGTDFDRAYIVRNEHTVCRFPNRTKGSGYQYPDAAILGDSIYAIYSINKEDIAVSCIKLSDIIPDREAKGQ